LFTGFEPLFTIVAFRYTVEPTQVLPKSGKTVMFTFSSTMFGSFVARGSGPRRWAAVPSVAVTARRARSAPASARREVVLLLLADVGISAWRPGSPPENGGAASGRAPHGLDRRNLRQSAKVARRQRVYARESMA